MICTTFGLRLHLVNSAQSMGRSGHYLPTHRPRAVVGRLTARLRLRTIFGLLVAVTSLALSRPAEAETYTWDGSSNASTWSDTYRPSQFVLRVSNWIGNSVPTTSSTSAYVFAGSTRTTNTNDIADLTALSMTFASDASAFTISGSAITLRGIVSNSSTNLQTLNLNLVLGTSGTFDAASADIFVGGTISGANTLKKTGVNDLILTAANTYSGATTISNGSIIIGNGGTSGDLGTGGVLNNATLSINRSNAYILDNTISGGGSVTQLGSGTTTLSGSNSYTGGTTIRAGAVAIPAGGSISWWSMTSSAGSRARRFSNPSPASIRCSRKADIFSSATSTRSRNSRTAIITSPTPRSSTTKSPVRTRGSSNGRGCTRS